MSGGHFDYRQHHVREIAEDIESLIASNGERDEYGCRHDYPADIIERFREAAHCLRRAAAMTQCVDWLVCGDDGEDSFRARWKKEVRACRADTP